MREMTRYNKLVRDRIPEIIESNGGKAKVKELDSATYVQELKVKLEEEWKEYLESTSDDEAMEELCDILEILHAFAHVHGNGFEELEAIRKKKFHERGGFEKRFYLMEAEQ
jgi:predicted house-cleaning noncanonical NTP pyrophosphatase (MazG superfamily)